MGNELQFFIGLARTIISRILSGTLVDSITVEVLVVAVPRSQLYRSTSSRQCPVSIRFTMVRDCWNHWRRKFQSIAIRYLTLISMVFIFSQWSFLFTAEPGILLGHIATPGLHFLYDIRTGTGSAANPTGLSDAGGPGHVSLLLWPVSREFLGT